MVLARRASSTELLFGSSSSSESSLSSSKSLLDSLPDPLSENISLTSELASLSLLLSGPTGQERGAMVEKSHVAKRRSGVKNRGCEEKRAFVDERVGKTKEIDTGNA